MTVRRPRTVLPSRSWDLRVNTLTLPVFVLEFILIDKPSITLQWFLVNALAKIGHDKYAGTDNGCHRKDCAIGKKPMAVPQLRRWVFHDASDVEQACAIFDVNIIVVSVLSLDCLNFLCHIEELTELWR